MIDRILYPQSYNSVTVTMKSQNMIHVLHVKSNPKANHSTVLHYLALLGILIDNHKRKHLSHNRERQCGLVIRLSMHSSSTLITLD